MSLLKHAQSLDLGHLGYGIGGRAREHGNGEQAGPDDAQREKQEGEAAGDGPQRLCGLRSALDGRHAMRVQPRR